MYIRIFVFAAGLSSVAVVWAFSLWAALALAVLVASGAAVYGLLKFHFWRQVRATDLALARSRVDWEEAKTRALNLASASPGANVKAYSDGALEIVRSFPPARVTVNELEAEPLKELPAAPVSAPAMEELYNATKQNALEVPMGRVLATGQIVTVPIIESVHFKIIGSSGFGKSCLAAAMLDVTTKCNSPDVLRIALLDLENKTSRLFADLPHILEVPVGRGRMAPLHGKDPDEVARMLGWLKKEIDRRAYLHIETPLILVYLEEMLSLQYEVDEKLKGQMLADLGIIALRARKYGIFFLACMQADYSTKDLREAKGQFRTRSGFAIDASAARAAGFINNNLIKQNFIAGRPGQYLLEKPGFSQLVLAPLYDVKAKLAEMANPSRLYVPGQIVDANSATVPGQFPASSETSEMVFSQEARNHARKQAEPENYQLAVMRKMVSEHKSQNEIISVLFPGMRNADAIAAYRELLAALVA